MGDTSGRLSSALLRRVGVTHRRFHGLDKKDIPQEIPNIRLTRIINRIKKLPEDHQNWLLDTLLIFLQNAELRAGITNERKRQRKDKVSNKKSKPIADQKPKKQSTINSIIKKKKKDPLEWTGEEVEALEIFYPSSPEDIVLDAIPGKSWWRCVQKAEEMGLKRRADETPKRGRDKKKPQYNISKDKLSELLKTNLTVEEIAKRLRTTPDIVRRHIFKWEL